MNREQILRQRIKWLTWFFVIGLFLSGATAIPVQSELVWLVKSTGARQLVESSAPSAPAWAVWLVKVRSVLQKHAFFSRGWIAWPYRLVPGGVNNVAKKHVLMWNFVNGKATFMRGQTTIKPGLYLFALLIVTSSNAQVRVGSAKSDDDSSPSSSKNSYQSQQAAREAARQAEFARRAAAIQQGSANVNSAIQQGADNIRNVLQDQWDRDAERERQRKEDERAEREQARQEHQQQQTDNNSSSSGYTIETVQPQPTVQPTRNNPYGIQEQNYYHSQPTTTAVAQPQNYYHSQPTFTDTPESNPIFPSLSQTSESYDEQLEKFHRQTMQTLEISSVTHQDDSIDTVPGFMDTVEQWGKQAANHVVSVVNFTGGQIQDAVKPATDFINQGAQKLQGAQKDLDDIININTDSVTGD